SDAERIAFREIGARLRRANEAIAARGRESAANEPDAQELEPAAVASIPATQEDEPSVAGPQEAPTRMELEPSSHGTEQPPRNDHRFRQVRSLLSLVPATARAAKPGNEQRAVPLHPGQDVEQLVANLPLPVLIHSGDEL